MIAEPEIVTRKNRNDKLLQAAGWDIVHYSAKLDVRLLQHHAVEELPTVFGPADYALFYQGELLGIVEGKKVEVAPKNVLDQAKRYSQGAEETIGDWHGFRVTFLNSTYGELIYYLDIRNRQNIRRQIYNFHTPEGLKSYLKADHSAVIKWLQNNPPDNEYLRDYQKLAITAVEEGLVDGKQKMLLAMATGTGKTFTTVNLVYRLLASKYARRILFLVDRKSLAAQAVTAFASFDTPRKIKFKDEYELYSQRFRTEDFDEDEK